MKIIRFIILSAFVAISAIGQSRIKDLPLSTQSTTNTSLILDDSTYGVRRTTLSGLAEMLGVGTNELSLKVDESSGVATNLFVDGLTVTDILADSLSVTNGLDVDGYSTLNGGLTVTGDLAANDDILGQARIRGNTLEIGAGGASTTNRILYKEYGGVITNVPNIDPTELDKLDGITGNIQSALDGKLNSYQGVATNLHLTGPTVIDFLQSTILQRDTVGNEGRVAIWDGTNVLTDNGVPSSYLAGLTANIQSQLDALGSGGGGGAYTTNDLPFVSPKWFGALMDGLADDTTAWEATVAFASTNAIQKEVWVPEGTMRLQPNRVLPNGLTIQLTSGTVIEPTAYPGSNYSSTEEVNGLFQLGDGNRLMFNGGKINMRRGSLSVGASHFSGIAGRGKTNIFLDSPVIEDFFEYGVYLRYCTNPILNNLVTRRGFAGPLFVGNYNLTLNNPRLSQMISTNSGVLPAGWIFFGNRGTRINGLRMDDVFADDTTASYALSGVNLWGEVDLAVIEPYLDGLNSSMLTTSNSLQTTAILFDGCQRTTMIGGKIIGWNFGAAIPIAIEGANDIKIYGTIIDGYNLKEPANFTGATVGSAGIFIIPWGIHRLDTFPSYIWSGWGYQDRAYSTAHRILLDGVTVRGHYAGMLVGGGVVDAVNCIFEGNQTYGVRVEQTPTSGEGYNINPIISMPTYVRLMNCDISYNDSHGVAIGGGDKCDIINCRLNNNDQSAVGSHGAATIALRNGTFTTGSSSTVLQLSSSIGSSDYSRCWIYIPASGISQQISVNTSTTITLVGAIATIPSGGDAYYITRGLVAEWSIKGTQALDDQAAMILTNACSLNPTQNISVAGTPFYFETNQRDKLHFNQRVQLDDVLTSGGDLIAKIVRFDTERPDRVWAVATSPTTGTFDTSTGAVIVTGTGTISYTDNPSSYVASSRLNVTGSGTAFGSEMPAGHYWINPNGLSDWGRTTYQWSNTQLYVTTPFSANFSGVTYRIHRFTLRGIKSQNRGWNITGSPIKWWVGEGNEVFGNSGNSGIYTPQAFADVSNALDGLPRLTVNSQNPTIGSGTLCRFANTSATTVTNLAGGYDGKIVEARVDNTPITIRFEPNAGTAFKGTGSTNDVTVATNSFVRFRYSNGYWFTTILQ